MAGPESTFWKYVKSGMHQYWDGQRHEDRSGTLGIPDVSYGMRGLNGWIELKVIPKWPVKPTTIVKIRHFTGPQRAWLINRGKAGGNCFMFLKVRSVSEYVLVPWTEIKIDDYQTRGHMIGGEHYWKGRINFPELADAISGHKKTGAFQPPSSSD